MAAVGPRQFVVGPRSAFGSWLQLLETAVGATCALKETVSSLEQHPRLGAVIRDAFRQGIAVHDDIFDLLFPEKLRALSHLQWTPVAVAIRAAELLAPAPGMRVLDVGSGVGKMCCIGALVTEANWYGLECHVRRVAAALKAARALDIDTSVRFTCGELTSLDWTDFDSVYLFNPFEAELFAAEVSDPGVAFPRFAECVLETERRLAELRPGARVVTYHGFGGEMPESFEMCSRENIGTDQLVLWVKRPRGRRTRWRAAA